MTANNSRLVIGRCIVVAVGILLALSCPCSSLQIVLAGGSGPIGQGIAARCAPRHEVTVLTRNAFLAVAPARVTKEFGWVGEGFLRKHRHVKLRDWDGGDLLDIVGKDWLGWQEDALKRADVIVHLVGGFTEQRVMACERLVRESLTWNPEALHVTVSPTLEDLVILSPGARRLKEERIARCEDLVTVNCRNSMCLRIEANRIEKECDAIYADIDDWKKTSR